MSIFLRPKNNGTEEEMLKDPLWHGLPPVGRNPIRNRYTFFMLILLVFIVKITLWTSYRWMTGNVYPLTNPRVEDWVSLFVKPLLQVGPLFPLWWFLFKERGVPFRITKVNLASSVFWGCIGGLIYYIVTSMIYVGQIAFFGFGSDFHIVSGWDLVGWMGVFSLMFTFMLSTGPAEEIFSRGFIQDQMGRAFPLAHAVLLSAFLFAIGHLPISIMVLRLSFGEIFWYMCSLVLMGFFFSVLYQWSRNIVLVAIIHGLYDWFLTMFAIRGAYDSAFLAESGLNFGRADFINTMLTMAVMLPLFYLIYRIFWKRLKEGERPGIDEGFRNLPPVKFLREHDMGNGLKRPWSTTFAVVGAFCLAMIPLSAVVGTDDPDLQVDRVTPDSMEPTAYFTTFTDILDSELEEGLSEVFEIGAEHEVVMVNITMTWTDEIAQGARYTNAPDTFKVSLMGSLGGELDSISGSSGILEVRWVREPQNSNETFEVQVDLLEAGDQTPIVSIAGLRDIPDTSNSFTLDITYTTVLFSKGTDEEDDVRW